MKRFWNPASKLVFGPHPNAFYPFGKARAIDVLADFIPSPSQQDPTKVLLLNATDLHTTMQTVTASSTSRNQQSKPLEIHLNNSCTLNVARNLFFFHVISRSSDFSATDFQYLWDVWFNLEWSNTTKERFLSDVTSFLKENNSPSNANVSPHVLEVVREIWSGWLSSTTTLSDPDVMEKFHHKRISQIPIHLRNPCVVIKKDSKNNTVDVKIPNMMAFYRFGGLIAIGIMPRKERCQLIGEAVLYYFTENGNCNEDNIETDACLNPTLFGPSADQWLVHPFVNPFNNFLPLPTDAIRVDPEQVTFFTGEDHDEVNLRIHRLTSKYCRKQLATLVNAFKKNMKEKVQLFFHNEDPLQMCYNPRIPQCDVIDCSDLGDEVGLANVIVSATNKLVKQPNSLLLTETRLWKSGTSSPQPNLEEYVKEELCAPLSMIPTLYGVQLATPVRLGSITPPDEKFKLVKEELLTSVSMIRILQSTVDPGRPITPPDENVLVSRSLKWRPAPSFLNVRLDHSEALENCLKQLKERCNLGQNAKPGSMYTSLTYSYICSGLAQRAGNRLWMQFGLDEVGSACRLSMKTIEDWREGRPISQLSGSFELSPGMKDLQTNDLSLSFVLAPIRPFPDPTSPKPTDQTSIDSTLHYLDNAHWQIIRSPAGKINEVPFQFLLPSHHGFESTHCALLIDNLRKQILFKPCPLTKMKFEIFTVSYPYVRPQSDSSFAGDKSTSYITCIETEKEYKLNINFPVLSPHMVSFADAFPCQSANRFTLTKEVVDAHPLELSFPHPVRKIGLPYQSLSHVFHKSFYEPLPQEFQRLEKWDSQKLSYYTLYKGKKKRGGIVTYKENHAIIRSHLRGQTSRYVQGYEILDTLRRFINRIFTDVINTKTDRNTDRIFIIKSHPSSCHFEWYLRVHLPLRISPDGAPMLVLSAFDTKLANHLSKHQDPFIASYHFRARYLNDETLLLFCYLLRFNSTLILPNAWQMKFIVPEPGKPSPWLTTFISPLYPDCPLPRVKGSIITSTNPRYLG